MKVKTVSCYRKVDRHILPDYCKNFSEFYKRKNIKISIVFSVSGFYNAYNVTIYIAQRGRKIIKQEYSDSQYFLVKNNNIYVFDEKVNAIVKKKSICFLNL